MHLKGEITGEIKKMNRKKVLLMLLLLCIATTGCVEGIIANYSYFTLVEEQHEIELHNYTKHIKVESDRPVNIIFVPKNDSNSSVYSKYNAENITLYDIDVQIDEEVSMYICKIGPEDVWVKTKNY